MHDFVKLTTFGDRVIFPLEYTISDTIQGGYLIYSSRQLTVNTRQVVVNKNDQVVVPNKGYGMLESKTESGIKKDEISFTMTSTAVNTAQFDTYVIRYKSNEPLYTFVPKIPMNYKLIGNVLTMTKQQHSPENSTNMPIEIDASKNPEFWLTTYISPVTDQPSVHHWDYKTNKLGEIKVK